LILIIDEPGLTRSDNLRREIIEDGLAAVLATEDSIMKFPEAIAALVFTNSEIHLSMVALRCKRIPVLACNLSGSRIYNSDVTFYNPRSGETVKDFLYGFILKKYGFDCKTPTLGDMMLADRYLRIGPVQVRLTPTERRIVALLMMTRDNWVSENSIHKAVSAKVGGKHGRIPVHICNINSKIKSALRVDIIETKREKGYRFKKTI